MPRPLRYVIEHRSRGVFVDWSEDYPTRKPRFRYSILRSEGRIFHDEAQANRELTKISATVKHCYVTPIHAR